MTDSSLWLLSHQRLSGVCICVRDCLCVLSCDQVVPLVLELTQRAADHMAQHEVFDVTDAAKRITSDVMGQMLYGEDLRGTFWE